MSATNRAAGKPGEHDARHEVGVAAEVGAQRAGHRAQRRRGLHRGGLGVAVASADGAEARRRERTGDAVIGMAEVEAQLSGDVADDPDVDRDDLRPDVLGRLGRRQRHLGPDAEPLPQARHDGPEEAAALVGRDPQPGERGRERVGAEVELLLEGHERQRAVVALDRHGVHGVAEVELLTGGVRWQALDLDVEVEVAAAVGGALDERARARPRRRRRGPAR